ncbi:MAG: hypothetical protein ACREM9_04365, partial [Gemmatimonadales bacterium]
DYEARLAPLPGADSQSAGATGKSEHERFADGEVEFEVRARGLVLPSGTEVEVRLNGVPVATAPADGGPIAVALSLRKGDPVPSVRSGDRVELMHRGRTLLEGTFAPE